MAPSESLSRKIRWIFILQGVAASVLVMIGTLYGSLLLRDMLLKQRLLAEVDRAWELVERSPDAVIPGNATFESYFVPAGDMPDEVPPDLRALSPGLHRINAETRQLSYVSGRAQGMLYVILSPGTTDRIVQWVSVLAVALSVLAIAFISWLGYRRCKRIVAPVSRLTDSVLAWDPRNPQPPRFQSAGSGEGTYEVAHLSDALNSMSRRVEEYVDRERNFTRDASHELRTPVTVVRVAGDLLESEALTPRGERSLRRIRQATQDLESLIDAFLVLARHPDVPVDSEDLQVQEIVHEEVAAAVKCLEGKDVKLHVAIHADPEVHAPPRVMGVILSQLLRNACNFTEQGRVDVSLETDRIEIRDTGIGMDEDTMAHAFDPFWRADISDYTAKGMGLTIAQRLAERFGWSIALHSEPGRGTLAVLKFS